MDKLKKLEDSVENLKKVEHSMGTQNLIIFHLCIIDKDIAFYFQKKRKVRKFNCINIICSAISNRNSINCSTTSNNICRTISNADKTEFFKKKEYFQPSNQILETFTKALSQNNAFIINLKVFQIFNHFLKAKKKNHQSSYHLIKLF
ncbi:uncharacterized protein LOC105844591 isoform X2 [Hydra vulgaris]|uniref:uncharacterized protein LOC105844591 isoform X2 n=1 Tax=Hydra vulgaris TaxID=6087 RepID=UPI0032EA6B93